VVEVEAIVLVAGNSAEDSIGSYVADSFAECSFAVVGNLVGLEEPAIGLVQKLG